MRPADLSKRMARTICALAFILAAAAALYYRSTACLPFVLGVLLGSAVSVAKVFLLERAVDRAVAMDKKAVAGYIHLQYLLRFSLTGAALTLAALVPAVSLWGAAAGVVSYQIAAHTIRFTKKS